MVYKAYVTPLTPRSGSLPQIVCLSRHLDLFVAIIHAAEGSSSPHLKRFPDTSNIEALRFQALGLFLCQYSSSGAEQ